ncbi:hypothetical protein HT136_09670 [Novosphingobium profundi]|uniref:hypothetical protein n=1 Tax=Novosphingobium profundi TaxID=1774954 RepID=UPI001BD95713|nr:hypothetical protein [Novosphingobium profundi]MBT0668635.1 hypothetical protein [Novosphingobium profundi]
MIGKIIGAVIGRHAAKNIDGITGTSGTIIGIAAPTLLKRMGPIGLITLAAGGYFYKKHSERREARRARPISQ